MSRSDDFTLRVQDLGLERGKPLIISDADEVIVHFAEPFKDFLAINGLDIDFSSYRLAGNIRWRDSGAPLDAAEVPDWINRFFEAAVADCPAVDGAVEALESLAQEYQIVILSNVPAAQETARRDALAGLGMGYPVLSNSGPKGPAVSTLARFVDAPAVFIDDISTHHQSVMKHADQVHRLHFVADGRLAKLLDPSPHAHARIDDWHSARPYIVEQMTRMAG